MTQKNKELLLKDLCAKLPYEVKVATDNFHNLTLLSVNLNGIADVAPDNGYPMEINWEDCKPYLFPLQSMTEKQKEAIYKYCQIHHRGIICCNYNEPITAARFSMTDKNSMYKLFKL